jgi:hypothetical protein
VHYQTGSWAHLDSEKYATLAEAADALRRAMGWTELHLTDSILTTEAALPTCHAYPTAELRDADDWMKAPCIYEI